jgi:hypothetical protein
VHPSALSDISSGVNAFALASVIACGVGVALAWLRIVPALAGFAIFGLGGLGAVLAALATVVRLLRGRAPSLSGVVAIGVATAIVASALPGIGMPRINDFTTDLADPPAFTHAGSLAPNVGRDLGYPAEWASLQRECCADLRAAVVPDAPAAAYARALALASAMPDWDVVARMPESGTLEAVATTRVFGFKDDVVIRVRPGVNGGSRVDVRSKSRDGQGDVGANAARIRRFVDAIEANG